MCNTKKNKTTDNVSSGPVEGPTTNTQRNTPPSKNELEAKSSGDSSLSVDACSAIALSVVDSLKTEGLTPVEALSILNMAVTIVTWHVFQMQLGSEAGAKDQNDGSDGMYL
jgi:hypothetical protein